MSGDRTSARGAGYRVMRAGPPLTRASHAVILVHGRGGGPEDMLRLAEHLALPDVAWLAPEAPGNSWWATSFLASLAENGPGLRAGLEALGELRTEVHEAGVAAERTFVMGFSQGACLALEYAARTGGAGGGAIALSGALLGTDDIEEPARDELYGYAGKTFDYDTSLDGVPVFIGCHERDPHIPLARVHESERVLTALGASVTVEIYPGAGHGVVEEALRHVRGLLHRA